jgi:hypothetical protein
MRRSSTSRSIGHRSDFGTSIHGDGDSIAPLDDEYNDRSSSVIGSSSARGEADGHVRSYVADQLQRLKSHDSLGAYEDEFETQLDETPKGD